MSSLKSLGEIIEEKFKDKKVYIPLYQRNYKWDAEMAGKLAQDLLEQFNKDKDKDYNLGVLTLYETNNEIQIIDGQQRMITLSLIVKALGKIKVDDDWFYLLFERDSDFEDEDKDKPRYYYIYEDRNTIDEKSIDVARMKRNLGEMQKKIQEIINGKKVNDFFEYILNHVKFLYRETKSEPIDEFLNMNFNKTPFCAADHIKAYMVLDADANKKDITVSKVQELWKKLERVLFQIENCSDMENEMFSLIKKNYNEEILNMNRMEILFYNRYLEEQGKGKNAIKKASKYHKNDNSLKDEYNRLSYYYDVMKNVLDEIAIVDKDGNRHPNYNALNAFNLLCNKEKDIRFFEIIGKERNIKNKIDVSAALKKHFNLTETSHEEINSIDNPNAQNQFMETMLSSQNDHKTEKNISERDYIKDSENFKEYYEVFNKSFDEYISLIEEAKKANSGIDKMLEDGKKILLNLLEDPNIERIKIPSIQRDYVMGSSDEYLKDYLQHISWRYSWSCYSEFKSKKIDDKYIELEDILFKKNSSKKILELKEIKPSDGNRQHKYNKYKSSLKNSPNITDFRRNADGSPYANFCIRINELAKLYESFNASSIYEGDYDKKFNTGCIMGYLDEDKTFWVYDGQQRLVTSIVLLALTRDKQDSKLLKNLKKFSFEGRNGANKCLEILLDADVLNNEITNKMRNYIDDKSSYSIYKLIENYNVLKEDCTIKINADYLLKGMEFEFVVVDKIDDVEQVFIEMNEGVRLTPDEQYKAEFNYTVSKILDNGKAKSLLRKIDNEWLNFYKTEEKEVRWLKYCVKMACYEINGYDNSLVDDSLQGLNQEVILLIENVVDRLLENNIDIADIADITDAIVLWARIMFSMIDKDKVEDNSEGKIYFEKDFEEFVKNYLKFIPNEKEEINFHSKCFKMIKEFRSQKCLTVSSERLKEGEKKDEGSAEKIYGQMLENRKDQFEFREISKWEKALDNYDLVMKNKGKPFALAHIKPKEDKANIKITEDVDICKYIDKLEKYQLIILCENVISNSTSSIYIEQEFVKKVVLENEKCCNLIFTEKNKLSSESGEYYRYANCQWRKNDTLRINNKTQNDLSKAIIDAFTREYQPVLKTSIDVDKKILEECNIAKDIYNILTGSWYLGKNVSDFERNITGRDDISVKSVSETNYRVFKWVEIDNIDELLYRYKYCDDKAKECFENYITAHYFYKTINGDYQEKLYYMAKCYLKGKDDIRRRYLNKYREIYISENISEDIKKNILPLFLDKDFEDKNSGEYKYYCKQRGFCVDNINNLKESEGKGEF